MAGYIPADGHPSEHQALHRAATLIGHNVVTNRPHHHPVVIVSVLKSISTSVYEADSLLFIVAQRTTSAPPTCRKKQFTFNTVGATLHGVTWLAVRSGYRH